MKIECALVDIHGSIRDEEPGRVCGVRTVPFGLMADR
jgi:hypothetical protein